ncbi:MAG TPA: hypothetical protein VME92_02395 [Acetobacteraceae bacterium]|nr:hypothetical protein [Acetobacteraceae bacterium]
MSGAVAAHHELRLRAGEWVRIRPADAILATLDERGRLDGLQFMPEMAQYCGARLRVHKSAHKTCDPLKSGRNVRMERAVHLEGLRCDGQAHGGCEAACLLFWKEAWLERTAPPEASAEGEAAAPSIAPAPSPQARCDAETLMRETQAPPDGGAVRYVCQATALLDATTPLHRFDPRPYVRDLLSGNVGPLRFAYFVGLAALTRVIRRVTRQPAYPYLPGLAKGKTPTEKLDLQPGELVQVRSRHEIMQTLDARRRNRGLYFDVEMEPFCGKTLRVQARVRRVIDEHTGRMVTIARDCLILEGAACGGCRSVGRLFCPRGIYPFWREIWLRRVAPGTSDP